MQRTFLLILLNIASSTLMAQSPFKEDSWNFAQYITANTIKQHVYVLASDSLEGRETGTRGQYKAAKYISDQYEQAGLKPLNQSENPSHPYYQNFNLEKIKWLPSFLVVEKDTLYLFKHFYAKGHVDFPETTLLNPVFAGYGIETENYNDYQNLSVRDKAVMILQGEPTQNNISLITGNAQPSEWGESWNKKVLLAYAKGAKAVFIIQPTKNDYFFNIIKRMRETKNGFSMGPELELEHEKALFITEQQALNILNVDSTTFNTWRTKLNLHKNKALKTRPKNLSLKCHSTIELIPTQNVIGMIEGTDLKNEYIFISAHLDHLGKKDEHTIYYGADDDGSGTATLMTLANAFSQAQKAGKGPRRSIVFTAFTGEEMGLLGSNFYTAHPLVPLAQTITDLNIDMIGRVDEKHADDSNYVYLIGSNRLSSELHELSEATNKQFTQLELDYTYNDPADPNQLYYRSDHYNFAKKGIPVIFYFTGLHKDYHKTTDTPDKLLYLKTSTIGKLVFHTAWALANQTDRIKVDSK